MRNGLKTALLLGALSAFILLIGSLFGRGGLFLALLVALGVNGYSYFFSDRLALRVQCQHGTYVKEWVSGDEQRTSPSLATVVGQPCHCAQLDVEEVLTDDVPGPRLTAPAADPRPA